MTAPYSRNLKQLDAGMFQAEISSFALRLAAEGKAAKTIRTYTEAVQWFAAAGLQASHADWDQVTSRDIQQWMAWLLDRYSSAYASNQYRALQQFFKWLAAEDELPDPMQGLQPPHVAGQLVPVFTPEELTRLEHACAGRSFAQRRDTAIIAVAPGHRHPAGRTGRPPLQPRRPAAQRHRPLAAGNHRPQQGRQAPDRKDRPPDSPQPRPVPARPRPGTPRPGDRSCGWASTTGSR